MGEGGSGVSPKRCRPAPQGTRRNRQTAEASGRTEDSGVGCVAVPRGGRNKQQRKHTERRRTYGGDTETDSTVRSGENPLRGVRERLVRASRRGRQGLEYGTTGNRKRKRAVAKEQCRHTRLPVRTHVLRRDQTAEQSGVEFGAHRERQTTDQMARTFTGLAAEHRPHRPSRRRAGGQWAAMRCGAAAARKAQDRATGRHTYHAVHIIIETIGEELGGRERRTHPHVVRMATERSGVVVVTGESVTRAVQSGRRGRTNGGVHRNECRKRCSGDAMRCQTHSRRLTSGPRGAIE